MSALLKQKPASSRKLNHYKFELGGPEKFQKVHPTKVGCWDILNVVNIKDADFVKQHPHWGSNHLLPVKVLK